ncbi:MAG TPA: zinc dependent phospholipase C family protein, partial [Puia sp.]|nr:zinc dependent phospholipase C family protein [Puia sp.]
MSVSKTSIRLTVTLLLVLSMNRSQAYSILAHEALIDSCWATSIRPLLLAKFPGATEAQLKTAHAYAYGGAIAPDIGYFPFGSPFFTNLVHYVRSGDFVNALLADARDLNEYAFAIGFLSHYMADRYGHSLATNKSVPLLYPKVRKKYGNWVTYEENHLAHKRVEFGYDVLQTVEGDYTKIAYHDFIGFEISDGLLERAFTEVYGLDIHKVFPV